MFFPAILSVLLLYLPFHLDLRDNSPCTRYLVARIPKTDKRYQTFVDALALMNARKAKVIVETGTARNGYENFLGDGGSTVIFAHWASEHGSEFYSVDIDKNNIATAKQAIGGNYPNAQFIISDSIEFLRCFDRTIDFLYLDSYDFEQDNPLPSQMHHLKEIQVAYPLLTENSVVMIDDCGLPHGGKGKLAIEFLLSQGWKIYREGYQVILVQK